MPSKARETIIKAKKARKAAAMGRPGHKSNYSRKAAFLRANGGFGFQWGLDGDSKPWK